MPHYGCPKGEAGMRVLAALQKATEPVTMIDIQRKAGVSPSSVRAALHKLEQQKRARRHPILSGGMMDFWELLPEAHDTHP